MDNLCRDGAGGGLSGVKAADEKRKEEQEKVRLHCATPSRGNGIRQSST